MMATMARIRKIVQSMPDDTRPPPPPNMHYLFRSAKTALAWALVGLLACLLTWAALIGLWLWVTR
jgi:hypothetical protein